MKTNQLWARLLVALTVFALILSACAPAATTTPETEKTQEPSVKPTEPAAKPTEPATAPEVTDAWESVDPSGQTVKFWHNHTRARETSLLEIIEEFNKTNEFGITVEAEYQGNYPDIYGKMLTFLNTSDAPNLVVAYQNQAATYQLAESLVDMNSLVASPKWGLSEADQNDFFAGFWQQDIFPSFQNARLGLAPNRSMEVMFVNMDWLKELGYNEVPTTPEQFKEIACKASKTPYSKATAEGSMGYVMKIADASTFASWVFAFGGDIYDYQKDNYTYNSDAAKQAITFLQGMFAEGCAAYPVENFGEQTDFGAGKALFVTGSSSGLPFYQTAVEGGSNHAWTVMPLPHTTDEPVMNIYGASVSIPKTTPEAELATWLFLKYYTGTEAQAKWAIASQYFPVRASVADGLSEYFTANPAYKTAFDMLQYGRFEPPVVGYDPVRVMVGDAMAKIVDGADVNSTLEELNTTGNAELQSQMALIPESPDEWAKNKVDPSGQTVKFWHNHTKERETALLEIVDEFNKTNTYGITMVAEYQGSYADIYQKVLPLLNSSDVPDLVVAYQNQAATYALGEGLLDMTSLVNSYKYGLSLKDKSDFFTGFYNQDIFPNFKNARFGFPPNRSMEVMFVNQDWLTELGYAELPLTPELFKEASCKAAATPFSKATAEGNTGYEMAIDASNFAAWTFAFGGDIYDAKKGVYTYNSDAAVAAATYLQGLFADGCATNPVERYGEQTDFGAGKALFVTGSSSGLPFYQSAVEAGSNHAWTVMALPYTGKDPAMNVYGASVSMPKYYTSAEVQAKWAMVSQYFPVRASVAAGLTEYFDANPAYKTAFDMLKFGKFEPAVPGYDPVREKVAEAVVMILDGADVVETLTALNEEANAILAEQMATAP